MISTYIQSICAHKRVIVCFHRYKRNTFVLISEMLEFLYLGDIQVHVYILHISAYLFNLVYIKLFS